ncbi:MAG TPA: APC family permease [Terriglobales bacterium]|nr:APC family permease [Terriglobales bacterium]
MKTTEVFARKSSGLVRVMSPYSAFAYNVLNIGVIFPWVYLLSVGSWPDANVPLGILICGIFTAFLAVVYSGLASAMPRTGGDYVFQSRTLRPWIGFAIVATMIPTFFLHWEALGGWLTSVLGLAPLFTGLGLSMNNPGMLDLGLWFTTPLGIWITSIVTSLVGAVVLIKGFKLFVQIQWVMWYGFLLSFAIMAVLFFITPREVFIQRFNQEMSVIAPGTTDFYHSVTQQAVTNGFTPVAGISLMSTLFVVPVALTSLGWVGYTQEQAGEIQGASSFKNQVFINLGGGLFSTVLMMILAYAFINTVGQDWLASAAYGNYITGTVSMPIPPWFSNLAAVLTDNPILIFLMIIGVLLNAIQVVWNVIIGWTRVSVAMSIDGVFPKFLSTVSQRTHTPVNAHIIFAVLGGVVYSYVYNFVPGYITYTLAVTAVATVMYIGTAVGGGIFPWTRKEVYNTSPVAKYKIAGIPLITICAAVATVFSLWMLIWYMTNPGLLVYSPPYVLGPMSLSEGIMLAIFVFWVVYFFIRRAYLKGRGIDLDLAFKEVPPV